MLGQRLVTLAMSLLISTLVLLPSVVHALDPRAVHDSLLARYTTAHSLGDNYQFDPRDGWQSVNISNLQYKYTRDYGDPEDDNEEEDTNVLVARASKKKSTSKTSKSKSKSKSKPKAKSKSSSTTSSVSKVASSFKKVLDSLKGTGKAEPVTITWYTGHDLENPSCWPNPKWAPTVRMGPADANVTLLNCHKDASMACALTLEGWTTKPKCFKFLERTCFTLCLSFDVSDGTFSMSHLQEMRLRSCS